MDPDAEGRLLTRTLLVGVRLPGATGPAAVELDGPLVTWTGPADRAAGRPAERVEELHGTLLTSPFVDAHVHATASGLLLTGLDLTSCRSGPDVLDAVVAAPGGLVWGHGWEEDRWADPRLPGRAALDRASAGRPVYLSRIDVHSALVSTALVDRAPQAVGAPGWTAEGSLTADAHHHVRRAALAALPTAQRDAAQRSFLAHAAGRGIGEVHECAGPEISGEADLAALLAFDGVTGFWGEAVASPEEARELCARTGARGLAGDLFVDGSLGSRTAALHAPYRDAPECTGNRYLDDAALVRHVVACTRAGIPAGFHVIGDAAVESAVAAFEEAASRTSPDAVRAARHRLEHLEMVDPGQAARLASLGVVASVQPLFDAAWGGPDGMYAARLGEERALAMNPFAALHAAGVALAFGSDSPVTPVDPWATIRAATAHRTPGSSVDEATALAAHTGGRPVPVAGGAAGYALWDGDRCLRTVRAGRLLHQAM
ncbi:amidohydrolase [Pseudonocardia ailaonensis]|uniref:Amidohydrolase n=1 Tax=Pseudonocardia ailaonensis TaxID=367279 RepID=A0ABN2MMI8_9PSEU